MYEMKDIPAARSVNNGLALSKMLSIYHFEVKRDFKGLFLRANTFYLRYEKSEVRP